MLECRTPFLEVDSSYIALVLELDDIVHEKCSVR